MKIAFLLLAAILTPFLFAQNGAFPLESFTVQGSTVNRDTVLAIAELSIGTPIGKAKIEAACGKLQASGLFESINYRYAPAPKGGLSLTLSLTDQGGLTASNIDVPGVDETETWEWLKSQFPRFDRKVPGAAAAQEYLAKLIGGHLAEKLRGQPVAARMEDDLTTHRLSISFQPAVLPQISAMAFTGQQEIPADKLEGFLPKDARTQGYTDRNFLRMIELNLRPAYENHGMYRVKFPSIAMHFVEDGTVAVNTTIEEGPKYTLGEVTVSGEAPPAEDLRQAAQFKKGQLANWAEIQKAIWATETPLKRKGYLNAQARPERMIDDGQHVLNLKLEFIKGPLFHFGSVRFQGLTPDLEAQARKIWTLNPGDPFDYAYPNEFIRAFSKKADLRQFKKNGSKMQPGPDAHVMDLTIIFQ